MGEERQLLGAPVRLIRSPVGEEHLGGRGSREELLGGHRARWRVEVESPSRAEAESPARAEDGRRIQDLGSTDSKTGRVVLSFHSNSPGQKLVPGVLHFSTEGVDGNSALCSCII